jgi:long-chain acyl-CoA synthetase
MHPCHHARTTPDKPAFVMAASGHAVTYRELDDRSNQAAQLMRSLGLAPGDHIAILVENHPRFFEVCWGAQRCGVIYTAISTRLTAGEIAYIVDDCGAKLLVTSRALAGVAAQALPLLKGAPHRLMIDGTAPGFDSWEAALASQPARRIADEVAGGDMLYSSGTTGRPKGVLLSHANLLASSDAVVEGSELDKWEGPRVSLSGMPIAHIFGVAIMNDLLRTPKHLAEATRLVQMRWFEPESFMALIEKHRVNTTAAVPTVLALLLHHPSAQKYDLTSLVEIVCGGAPLPVELAQAFMQRYPCRIREVYGLTEASGMGTVNRRSEPFRAGSAGRQYINMEMQIVDDADRPLPTGQRGEICIRGPVVMRGYHNKPEATAETVRDGWLHTGDIGYLDADGFLFVVDRKKDMIIRGGENIFPAELEAVLHEHPAVAEAAVVGVPDEVYGENVVAFVVVAPGKSLSEKEVIEHACRHVAKFKAPTRVHFESMLPKSNIGKILRRVLRDKACETK